MRYNELIEGDSDRDLFGATPDTVARQELKQIATAELKQRRAELIAYVRSIARRHYNATTKVSQSASYGTATMLFGKEDQYSPNTQRLVAGVKAYLDDAGLQTKITNAGWLSVKTPEQVPADLAEDSDEELFGKDDDTRKTLRTLIRLRKNVEKDPRAQGITDLLKNYDNSNSTLAQRADMTLEYIAGTLGMTKDQFEAAAPDLMFASNFEYHRPWQLWDLKTIDKTIEFFKYAADHRGVDEDTEPSDDDLFSGGTIRERVVKHLENYLDELEMDLSHAKDEEEREWTFDEMENVREVYELAKRNLPAAIDKLVSDSESYGWAGSLLVDLEDAGINLDNHYTAPWLREDFEDDELFGATTMASRIEKLITTKQKVYTRIMGARGQVTGVRDDNLILKTRPHSTTRYMWGGLETNPGKYKLSRDPAKGVWYVDYAEDPWEVE